ncbi:MAG: hypothetical protein JKY96_00380 [Phycisphaerales bacterium]|nr:hypothetical protein [Phycisphaerales bacterium]
MTTKPMTIPVTSVLSQSDPAELAALNPLVIASEPRDPTTRPIMGIVVALGIILALAIFWFTRKRESLTTPTPIEQLHAIAQGECKNESDALQHVHRALVSLGNQPDLAAIRVKCEHTRFSDTPNNEPIAQSLATQALQSMEGV